jgi:hypothetical protein
VPNFISKDAIERAILKRLKEQFGYDRVPFKVKCDAVFDTMLTYASNGRKWAV